MYPIVAFTTAAMTACMNALRGRCNVVVAEQEFAKLGENILLAKPVEATEDFCSLLKSGCTPEDLILYTFEKAGSHLHVP